MGILQILHLPSVLTVLSDKFVVSLCKSLAISGLVVYLFHVLLFSHTCLQPLALKQKWDSRRTLNYTTTNISHLVFGIVGSVNTWRTKQSYIESWWCPNATRGYLFLEKYPTNFLPWPSSSPPFRVSENTSRFKQYNKHAMPHAIRMARVILETFKEGDKDVRWYVMADDDTVLFIENLVEVLNKYDHEKYFYIGQNSESVSSNWAHSFEMAFGGAGYALSYPLAEILVKYLDDCIKRYPYLYGSDHILQSCIIDLGVTLTHEKGFHQIDLHYDISGFLSAHPHTPFLSLHHLDTVDPIFPSMTRSNSVSHLMKAAKADQSRLLQQTICYYKPKNWSFSISWGYSAQIYEKTQPASILQRPLETFRPWMKTAWPPYMFNTRQLSSNSCEVPHVFFFHSLEKTSRKQIVTSYIRTSSSNLRPCSSSGNHSADHVSTIRIFSPMKRQSGTGNRRECCDIIHLPRMNATEVKFRACLKDEIVA